MFPASPIRDILFKIRAFTAGNAHTTHKCNRIASNYYQQRTRWIGQFHYDRNGSIFQLHPNTLATCGYLIWGQCAYSSWSVKALDIDGKCNIILLHFELMSTQLTEFCAFILYFALFCVEEESSHHFPFFYGLLVFSSVFFFYNWKQ